MQNNNPLVSVPVITYNSSKYVLETLESIKAQTYQNIELIVSDDCSTDNTVEICRKWIDENNCRFVRTEIVQSNVNTGVSANVNRSRNECKGVWIKGIAGDDILLPNCIEECVNYVIKHPNVKFLFSKMEGFGYSQDAVDEYMNRCFDYSFFSLPANEQYKYLVFKGNCIPAPTFFYIKEYSLDCDERIPMIDDYPLWIKMTKSGLKLDFIDKILVRYRLSEGSISTTSTPSKRTKQSSSLIYIYYIFNPRFKKFKSPIKKLGEIRKYIHSANNSFNSIWWKLLFKIDALLSRFLNKFGCNIKI